MQTLESSYVLGSTINAGDTWGAEVIALVESLSTHVHDGMITQKTVDYVDSQKPLRKGKHKFSSEPMCLDRACLVCRVQGFPIKDNQEEFLRIPVR